MSKYVDEDKVGVIVDEWGCWYDVEPGTNPAFLYQQNTMRDAMVAAINFDIFNHNCKVVRMANIAQIVNVLASVILTEGSDMILTPTYYAFHMYRHHQGADLIHTNLTGNTDIGMNKEEQVPKITQTASLSNDGTINLTITNVSTDQSENVNVTLAGINSFKVTQARILTGKIDEYNTFENHNVVSEADFNGYTATDGELSIELPPCSIVLLRIEED